MTTTVSPKTTHHRPNIKRVCEMVRIKREALAVELARPVEVVGSIGEQAAITVISNVINNYNHAHSHALHIITQPSIQSLDRK